jgi:glycosyltransferase involved in cell wall biosynthesis
MEKGGAEGVSMNVLESLQHCYDVTLLTLTDPNITALNDYYNTNVEREAIDIERLGLFFPTIYRYTDKLHLFKNACLSRLVKREQNRFELIISTYNEFSFQSRSLQYIHMPQFRRWIAENGKNRTLYDSYDKLCKMIEGFDVDNIRSNHLVANSAWTTGVTENIYSVSPKVMHPPVDTKGFVDTPWTEREDGFVTVGRMLPYKNVDRTINIIRRVNERDHDIHLHVVGPVPDTAYAEEIRNDAGQYEFIHLAGEVSREELVELISTHKYGIHGTDHEHFGMAVAELAAGGAIPFVPNGGGQREIVHEREELLYETTDEAVEKIDRILSNTDLQMELSDQINDIEERFGRERFKREIGALVEDILNTPDSMTRTAP